MFLDQFTARDQCLITVISDEGLLTINARQGKLQLVSSPQAVMNRIKTF